MQITVFGASGKVGQLVVKEALARGIEVVAFVHRHNAYADTAGLRVIAGDIYDKAAVSAAVTGSSAVLSCLGSWGTARRDVVTSAVRALVPAMQAKGVKRIITLTGSGAITPDIQPSQAHKLFMSLLYWSPAGKVFHDGEEHMKILLESGLDWTTIRSPVMNTSGSMKYHLSFVGSKPWETIHRQAVANAMLDQLVSADFSRRAPIIHR